MTYWLLRALGVRVGAADQVEQLQWLWHRPAYLWVGLFLAAPLAYLIATRQRKNQPHLRPRWRGTLVACRVGFVLLLMAVLAGPYVRVREDLARRPVVIVLADESASMSLPALPESDLSRAQLLRRTWTREKAVRDELRRRFDLREYRFAADLRDSMLDAAPPDSPPDSPPALDDAWAGRSALGWSLEQALGATAGAPVAGVVVFSDGQTSGTPNAAEVVTRAAARWSRGLDRPTLVTVPVGATQPSADVSVIEALAPARVTVGDSVRVLVTLATTGFDGQEIDVTLRDGGSVLDRQTLTLRDGRRQRVELSFTADTTGARGLTVEASPPPGERFTHNNTITAFVDATDDRVKVLYLEYGPRWDFRFLDHGLRRDRGVSATLVMQSQLEARDSTGDAGGLPTDMEGWSRYDLVMLGDVSPALLPATAQEQLAEAVSSRGVGLLVQAGVLHMPHAFVGQPLERLLPVACEPVASSARGLGGIEALPYSPFVMRLSVAGSMHPAFQVYETAQKNRQAWERMPVFYWMASARREKAGATVLATAGEHGPGAPLIAEHLVGRGRVLWIGTDSTFLWRRNVGDHFFGRFWGQAIRHAARRDDRAPDRSWIEATPRQAAPGDTLLLRFHSVDKSGAPDRSASATLRVKGDGVTASLAMETADSAGLYQAQWRPDVPGLYTLSATDAAGKTHNTTVLIAPPRDELADTSVNREALGALAELAGGTMLELEQLGRLSELLDKPRPSVPRVRDEDVWDNWLTLALLAGLYCLDIGIRRMQGAS